MQLSSFDDILYFATEILHTVFTWVRLNLVRDQEAIFV